VILWLALAAEAVPAITVTSEFVPKPRAGAREILSPAVPRNAWSVFHVHVHGPSDRAYRLYVGQNPDDAVEVRFFDGSKEVELPVSGKLPEEGVASYRLEVFAAPDAEVRRIKLEPQVYMEPAGWIVYPMEVRIVAAKLTGKPLPRMAPEVSWESALRARFCREPATATPRTLAQDLSLAASRPDESVREAFARALALPVEKWCLNPVPPANPEWYLKFRDWLLR
jgi:hypothetical protein